MGIDVDEMPPETAFHPRRRRAELAALAVAQHGAVSRRDLVALGFTRHEIEGMVRAGWLHRVHHGVYAVGRRSLGPKGRWMAAVLACGPGALLSHRSAADHRGLRRSGQPLIDVTVPSDRGRRIAGVRTYVSRCPTDRDREIHDAIPCTSVAVTLLNLAAVAPRRQVERACDEAEVQRLFDRNALDELLARSHGRRGASVLRCVLREHAIGTTLTREGLEELALALFDNARIPRPEVNIRVVCRSGVAPEVDFLWRRQMLVLEADGGRFHRATAAIERDRRKESDLVRAGYCVLRCTWWQVEREPRTVGLMVHAALAA